MIKMVEITGNRKINTETIQAKMKSREGTLFSKKNVKDDIKKLYRIGYFDDIRVNIESFEGGVKLTFIFKEKPEIVSMDFQGNKEFKADELRENITLTTGAIANLSLITDNAKRLVLFYHSKGYWLATVIPILNRISDEAAALTFQIHEGSKVWINTITIEGNNAISDSDIKDVMETGEWWIFSFLTDSGIYDEEQIRADIMKIRDLYQSRGYLYVAVSEPKVTLSPDKKNLFLTISVSEGDQYRVGDLSVSGNTVFSDEELFENVKTAPGQIFDRGALNKDIDMIIERYMNRGYARADVNPMIDVNREAKLAHITLAISEGGIFRIGRINILGNVKTRDKVIRREIRLDEGDIFNKSMLKRSYQRISNLNYFESVDIKPVPKTEKQLMDLDVVVEEKMTGMLSIGGGYSSLDKFMITGEITQSNLFGKGLYLKLKVDFSARRSNYNISLRDPWFMDRPLSVSIGAYNESTDYIDYDKKASGAYIGLGKELSEYVGGNIKYKIEQSKITNVSTNASSLIKDQEGSKLTSSIHPSIWRDSRDSYIDPSEGSKNALYISLAGLGGDNYFFKGVVDSLWYFPVIWETTFSIRGRYGYATGYNNRELPLYERFYVGGINTIRGLAFGDAGPRNKEGEKIGGVEELIFNFEFIFPISKEAKLKGVLFFDYGSAFDNDEGYNFTVSNMRQTVGAGVRWLSPFGPLRLEWGFNIDPKEDEASDKFEFSMGGIY